MSVPVDLPANVPASNPRGARSTAPANPGRKSRGRGGPTYVTREPSGWRFQWRLPGALAADFRLAGLAPIVRASLGPRGRGEARRIGRQLATFCDTVFALAAARKDANTMSPMTPEEETLAKQVVDACQTAIGRALQRPSQAIGLAKGLGAALTSLQLVQSEVAKGAGGARAVVDNADALTRNALIDVLKLSAQPSQALAALAAVPVVAPTDPPAAAVADPMSAAANAQPTYGAISQAYIDMRKKNDGEDHPDIASLELRRKTFIDLLGDRPIDQYYPSDLQSYVAEMQWWPGNVTKRSVMEGMSTRQILDESKRQNLPPMALKTIQDGYVTNIRTMGRHRMQDLRYRDPFAGAKIVWPQRYRRAQPREELGTKLINRIFRSGVGSKLLDETMLPPFAKLTSRRLGLLVYMRGSDIREKHGVFVAQTDGIVETAEGWTRVPYKTTESLTFFVIHNFFVEIGWVDWMMKRGDGWIFEAAHEHSDPSKYESKVMGRLLKRNGAKAGREVFHNLRGEAIDTMRHAKVESRSRRLQAGHELTSIHDKYSFEALSEEECQHLATLPLPKGIDWDIFKGLDFDALAAKRRDRGRPSGGGC